jgi:hypothetical protein
VIHLGLEKEKRLRVKAAVIWAWRDDVSAAGFVALIAFTLGGGFVVEIGVSDELAGRGVAESEEAKFHG